MCCSWCRDLAMTLRHMLEELLNIDGHLSDAAFERAARVELSEPRYAHNKLLNRNLSQRGFMSDGPMVDAFQQAHLEDTHQQRPSDAIVSSSDATADSVLSRAVANVNKVYDHMLSCKEQMEAEVEALRSAARADVAVPRMLAEFHAEAESAGASEPREAAAEMFISCVDAAWRSHLRKALGPREPSSEASAFVPRVQDSLPPISVQVL